MDVLTYFSSLLSILLGFIFIFWLYQDYRVDSFRQKMFHLRDDLFDEARKNNLPFDSDAYGILRSTINGAIRFGHKLSLWQMITFLLLVKVDSKSIEKPFSERLDSSLKGLSQEQAKIIRNYHEALNFLRVEHMLLSSPIVLLTVLIPMTFVLGAKRHVISVIKPFKTPLDKLDSAALAIGQA